MTIDKSSVAIAWVALALSIALGSLAQVTLKFSANRCSDTRTWLHYRTVPWLLLWALSFLGATVCWVFALRTLDISYAYPLLSLGYVIVTALAALVLREKVTVRRWTAVAVITVGAAMVAGSI